MPRLPGSSRPATPPQLKSWASRAIVKLVYKPVAFLDRASTTNYSSRALDAAAAVVDTAPGSFQAFHDLLYANQPEEGSAGLTDASCRPRRQAGAPATPSPSARLAAGSAAGWSSAPSVLAEVHLRRRPILVDGTAAVSRDPDGAQQMRDVVTKAAAAKGLPTPN